MSTDWEDVAAATAAVCPSEHYRNHAVQILARLETIGPLDDPTEELRRVYRFLHYNEPRDVRRVVQELLARVTRRPHGARVRIRHNAWRYAVAAYDQWYAHARIMYLVAGLLEGTLRSRLNERMTTVFGAAWYTSPDAVPSVVRDRALTPRRAKQMTKIEAALASAAPASMNLDELRALVEVLRATASDDSAPGDGAPTDGASFLASLTVAELQAFFCARRLHGHPASLKELLRDPVTHAAIPLSQISVEFEKYRKMRNDVAHYRLAAPLNFADALFTAATLAKWLGVDLQHFYGSVDARQSTELAHVLASHAGRLARRTGGPPGHCDTPGCSNAGPHDLLLVDRAPRSAAEVDDPALLVRRACPMHRVAIRAHQHRHVGL